MKKNLFNLFVLVFIVIFPMVYASSYGTGVYGGGLYEGSIISVPTTSTNSGGGGSICYYNWKCTEWSPSVCPSSKTQERICVNKGDCMGTIGIPNQTQVCKYLGYTEPLFDIYLTLPNNSKKICAGNEIKANIKLENYAKVKLIDVFMTYWIINKNDTLIVGSKDTRAVEKIKDFNIKLNIPESIPDGTYRLYVKITYGKNKTAVAGKSFEVLSQRSCAQLQQQISKKSLNWKYLIYTGIGIGLFFYLIFLVFFKEKSRNKKHKIIRKNIQYKNKRLK